MLKNCFFCFFFVIEQRRVHLDEFIGGGSRIGRQRKRSIGLGSVDHECRAGRAPFDRWCSGGRRPGGGANKFTRRKTTNALTRRIPGRSIGSDLRGV